MKSAVDMDHDESLLELEEWGAGEIETNQLHKIELEIFRTAFSTAVFLSSASFESS